MIKRRTLFLSIGLLCLFILSACNNSENEDSTADSTNESEQSTNDQQASEDENGEDESKEDKADKPDKTDEVPSDTGEEDNTTAPKDEMAVISEEVIFKGLADLHTIEVETLDGFIAIQITDFMEDDWQSLEIDTPMTIEYYENEVGQLVLVNYSIK